MKQLMSCLFLLTVVLPEHIQGQKVSPFEACVSKATFSHPKKHQRVILAGNMHVGVTQTNPRDIAFRERYLNGIFIGRNHSHPFLWGRERSSKLKNIQGGAYNLECRIFDCCQTGHSIYKTIQVKPSLMIKNSGYHLQNQQK